MNELNLENKSDSSPEKINDALSSVTVTWEFNSQSDIVKKSLPKPQKVVKNVQNNFKVFKIIELIKIMKY